jgi:hypothetical protein
VLYLYKCAYGRHMIVRGGVPVSPYGVWIFIDATLSYLSSAVEDPCAHAKPRRALKPARAVFVAFLPWPERPLLVCCSCTGVELWQWQPSVF